MWSAENADNGNTGIPQTNKMEYTSRATELSEDLWELILRTGGWLPGGDRGDRPEAVAVRRVCKRFDRWRTGGHTWVRLVGVDDWLQACASGRSYAHITWTLYHHDLTEDFLWLEQPPQLLPEWPQQGLTGFELIIEASPENIGIRCGERRGQYAFTRQQIDRGVTEWVKHVLPRGVSRLSLTVRTIRDCNSGQKHVRLDVLWHWVDVLACFLCRGGETLETLTLDLTESPMELPWKRLLNKLATAMRPVETLRLSLPNMHAGRFPSDFGGVRDDWNLLVDDLCTITRRAAGTQATKRLDLTIWDPPAAVAARLAEVVHAPCSAGVLDVRLSLRCFCPDARDAALFALGHTPDVAVFFFKWRRQQKKK